MHGRGRPGPQIPGYGVPYGQQIEEVDEDDFEDLQLFPFDEPTEEDILWMAQLIGIHPVRDKEFLYLAKESLLNPPTDEWMIFKDIAGNVIWINDVTEEMEPHPPHLHELMENFQRVKKKAETMSSRNSSNDRSNAMRKILGRNLPSQEPLPIEEKPIVQNQPKQQQGVLPRPGARPSSSVPQPSAQLPPQPKKPKDDEGSGVVGGKGRGLSLLKAMQYAQQQEKNVDEGGEGLGDSVFDRKLGKNEEEDNYFDDAEEEEEDENDDDEKGMLIGENEDESLSDGQQEASHIDESESEEVYRKNMEESVTPKPNFQTKQAVNNKKDREREQEKNRKDSEKKKKNKDTNKHNNSSLEKELENSRMLSKLMTDFQEMQTKMSQIEEENRDLIKKNIEISKMKDDLTKSMVLNQNQNNVQKSKESDESQSNLKTGIAEIKNLLERSILLQNDKVTISNDAKFEENRSIIVGGGHSESYRNAGSSKQQSSYNHRDNYDHNTSLSHEQNHPSSFRFSEAETKWTGIINREKENVHLSKMSLQNEKLILENRKLAIKKHEFEMRKELDQMKLEKGHPLSNKIKENLVQQLGIFKNEFTGWKEKCMRVAMQQKNLNLLEKSFQFSKSSGVFTEAADHHLQDLYSTFRESYTEEPQIEVEKELGFQFHDDGLSLDSHPVDSESDHQHFDDNQSKSEKTSTHNYNTRVTPQTYEPTEYNYNFEDIRRSVLTSIGPNHSGSIFERTDPHKENIKKYFANQSRFYSSMRKEVG